MCQSNLNMPDRDHFESEGALTRREFLLGALAASALTWSADRPQAVSAAEPARDPSRPLVVRIRSDSVVTTRGVHEDLAFDMLSAALKRAAGTADASAAWGALLRPDDMVGLKFNRNGAAGLGTSDAMARILVRSLSDAGFPRDQIVGIEASTSVCQELGIQTAVAGWSKEEADFGSGRDNLALWLNQVTAIVNVPFLKHHNITGFTCCLKNLSHAVVKHPARYHDNGCSPYIGDIVALPAVQSKLRLHIVNGLRGVFDHGPEAVEDFIWDGQFLLVGTDPVAVDCVALDLLDEVRRTLNLPPIAPNGELPAYLTAAEERGLGKAKLYKIDFERLKL